MTKMTEATTMSVILAVLSILHLTSAILKAEFHLKDETPASHNVGNIASASGIQTSTSPADFATFRYNLLETSNGRSLFTVNKRNGNIYTAKRIDREVECGFREECAVKLRVAVFSTVLSRFDVATITVLIDDVNDHSPMFPTNKIKLDVPESSLVGSTYVIDAAVDKDSTSKYAVQEYRLIPEGSPFELNVTQELDGKFMVYLRLRNALDREQSEEHKLTITAYDGGSPPKSDSLDVKIVVTDENDNAPLFRRQSYDVSIAENTTPGTSLISVTATDADTGDNADVRYRYGSRQADLDTIMSYFDLNSNDGVLTLKKDIVSRSGETIEVVIEAVDNGQPPRVGQTTVYVKVVDVGNNAPNVDINFLSSANPSGVSLSESASVGTLLAFVAVNDLDTGDNGVVTCMINDTTFTLQTVEGGGYLIATRVPLDRETEDLYYISIECRDNGTPAMITSKSFSVKIIDENDNKPIFSQDVYYVSVSENNRISEFIIQVSAKDEDIGSNAQIEYSVHKDALGHVTIDETTGDIKAIRRFDREVISQYNFTVYATDRGNPVQTGTATIVMNIEDQNDNAPVFKVNTFQFFVIENMASGIKIGRLSASDMDDGVNQNVLFTAVEGSLERLPFAVYQDGTIRTTEQLDREVTPGYTFLVKAFDLGSPSLTSTATVKVRVADENDNAPTITFPAEPNQTISVPFPFDNENVLLHIQAFDVDESGPNSYLSYKIVQGNEKDVFQMNENSGALYVKHSIDILKDEEFKLKISVQDNGYKPNEAIVDVTVVLKKFNESVSALSIGSGSRNAIVITAVVTLAIIGAATALTVVCIVRRNAQKTRKEQTVKQEASAEELLRQKQLPVPFKTITSTGTSTNLTEKGKAKVSFADDEDLENMELYNSTGTSMFTDTLIESQKMVTSADDESYSDNSCAHDSGRGGSYLDVYNGNNVRSLSKFGPKPTVLQSTFKDEVTLQHLEIL